MCMQAFAAGVSFSIPIVLGLSLAFAVDVQATPLAQLLAQASDGLSRCCFYTQAGGQERKWQSSVRGGSNVLVNRSSAKGFSRKTSDQHDGDAASSIDVVSWQAAALGLYSSVSLGSYPLKPVVYSRLF